MRPRWLPQWLITVAIVLVVIIVLAIIISALGGFDWHFDIGHFHWDFGVTKGA
jgi:hypothetical protein